MPADGAEKLNVQLRLKNAAGIVMGPGRAELLELIQATGSIAAAGRNMGMSYKRAWALVEAMNAIFTAPLVTTAKGGSGGGGAQLTTLGETLLQAYRALEAATAAAGSGHLATITAALAAPQPADKTSA